jgi:undecaprenyl pyrophosphate phosphatase UppP
MPGCLYFLYLMSFSQSKEKREEVERLKALHEHFLDEHEQCCANAESKSPIKEALSARQSAWIGAVQGLRLPFRGFSRSGATISTGLILGVSRFAAERFSFALAVVLTPPVIVRELLRLIKAGPSGSSYSLAILGMICSFIAGLLALRWLTRFLEHGRWYWFGYYCLLAALAVIVIGRRV